MLLRLLGLTRALRLLELAQARENGMRACDLKGIPNVL
jgi:hypothetical protein